MHGSCHTHTHTGMSQVTHMHESCHTYLRQAIWLSSARHHWMSHVIRMGTSRHTHAWVMSHTRTDRHESSHTHDRVMSHILAPGTWLSSVCNPSTLHESCHTYEYVTSHSRMSYVTRTGMSQVTRMTESCHTYLRQAAWSSIASWLHIYWIMSHIWVGHVTHTCILQVTHTCAKQLDRLESVIFECVMPHKSVSHATLMQKPWHILTHTHESSHTYGWVKPHMLAPSTLIV